MNLRIDMDVLVYRAAYAALGESPSHARQCMKTMMNYLLRSLDFDTYTAYLSNPDKSVNYRYSICPEYKANRGEKPEHYATVREFAVLNYDCVVASYGEADDALCSDVDDNTVIASIDKDLLMCPAYHYNIVSKKLIKASDPGKLRLVKKNGRQKLEGVGFKWFCAQMLTGDRIDNVMGIRGVGDLGAFKILKDATTMQDQWQVVVDSYKKHNMLCKLWINADLLWISRKYEERFFDWKEKHL